MVNAVFSMRLSPEWGDSGWARPGTGESGEEFLLGSMGQGSPKLRDPKLVQRKQSETWGSPCAPTPSCTGKHPTQRLSPPPSFLCAAVAETSSHQAALGAGEEDPWLSGLGSVAWAQWLSGRALLPFPYLLPHRMTSTGRIQSGEQRLCCLGSVTACGQG